MALDGSTSSFIPYTLNGLQDIAVDSSTVSTLQVNSLVPNRAVVSDGSNYLISSNATSQELEYLSGTTSNIQTQLNNKASTSYVDTNFLNKTTVSAQSVAGETTFLTGAKFDYITASKIPIIDANKKLVSSGVDSIKITYLDNVSSDIQTQLNSKAGLSGGNTFTGSQTYSDQTASRVAVFDGSKNLVSSTITTTTLSYLDATSSIQSQLNSKANLSGGNTFTGSQTYSDQTASRVAVFDGSKNMISSTITTTTLSYLDATSSIQTQLNSKANLSGGNTFTGSQTYSDQTASRVAVFDGSKNMISSSITTTTLSYLDATSSIQTQLNSKAALSGGNTFSGLQTYTDGIQLNASPTGNFTLSAEYIDPFTQNLLFSSSLGSTIKFTGDYGFINSTGWTPNKVSVVNTDGNLVTSSISTTELGYLSGTSSNLQTQINSKSSIAYVDQQTTRLPRYADVRAGIAPDGQPATTMSWYFGTHTNNGVTPYSDLLVLNGWDDVSGGKTNMLSFNKGTSAGIRQYHGDYGSTSNFSSYRDCVMTDFNSANVTLGGTLSMGANKVTSTATPTTNDDLTRKGYVDAQDGLRLLKAGDVAEGTIFNSVGDFHPFKAGDVNRGIVLFANNADGASYTSYNGGLASWYGIGFKSTIDSITRFVFDTRSGNSDQVGTMTAGGINNTGATANRVAIFDVNKNLVSSSVTDTTLTYLDIGSSLTGLLATKANLSGAAFSGAISAPTMGIGTTSSGIYTLYTNGSSYTNGYAYINGNIFQYGADFNIQNAARGAGGRALVHDASNVLAINYGGDFASVRIDSNVSLGANAITSTTNPTTADQLSRKGYVDSVVANYLPLTGGTLSGALTVNGAVSVGNRFLGLPDASPIGNFWIGLRGTNSEIDRLAISIVGNQTTGVVDRVVIAKSLRLNQPTASRVLTLNASGDVTSSSVTDTTLTYLDIGSSLTSLLNLKANLAGPQTFTNTHTFSSATPITLSGLTADRVLVTNASQELKTSTVTTTTLGYLDATSSVQTQLNSKASITYVDTQDSTRVLKAGDTMTGVLNVDVSNTYAQRAANPLPSNFVAKSTSGRLYMGTYYTGGAGACSTIQSSDYYSSADHGTTLFLNPLGGNVAIGTSTEPTATLYVESSTTAPNSGILTTRYYMSSPGDNQDSVGNDNIYGPWYGVGYSGIPGFTNVPCLAGYYGCALRSGLGYMVLDSNGKVGIGTVSLSDTFQTQGTASFSGNVGIGAATKTGVQLRLSDSIQNRKIVLYDGGFTDDHQYYGFGINGNTLRFNVPVSANDRFSFFAGTSSTTSTEVFRINGTGELGSAVSGSNANTTPNLKMSSIASHIDNNAGEVWLFTAFSGHMAIGRNGNRDATTTNLVLGVSSTDEAQVISVNSNNTGYKPMSFAGSRYTFVTGPVNVAGASPYAVPQGLTTAAGSLVIGGDQNYGGSWNAGFLMECKDTTEMTIHDYGARLASFMYYSGNTFTIGRDIGFGVSNVVMGSNLQVNGNVGIGTANPRAKLQVDQGFGNNNNGIIITNSNYGSDQYMLLTMMNDGFNNFGSYAKIQGKNTGVAAPTPIVLQTDGGTVGVGIPIVGVYQEPIAKFTINASYSGGQNGAFAINATDGSAYSLRLYPYVQASGQVAYQFRTINQGTGYNSISLGYNGDVGIGTNSPGAKLHIANGDSSVCAYGPNATWNARLRVGSGTSDYDTTTAQVISTNGNLHLDSAKGKDTYINYYNSIGATLGTTFSYGDWFHNANFGLTSTVTTASTFNNTSNRLVFNDGNLRSGACSFWTYYNSSVAWTYGLTVNNAFYVPNTTCCILITFTASHYVGGATGSWCDILITPNGTITPSVNPMPAFFFNLGGVHTQVNHQFVISSNAWGASTVGWKQIYFQGNTGGGATSSDTNDTLAFTVTIIG